MLSPTAPTATAYRRVLNLIGWSLVVFWGIFFLFSILDQYIFAEILTGKIGTALYGVFSSVCYMGAFFLAGVLFYRLNQKTPTQPVRYELNLPAITPLLILGGLAVITAGAYVNSWFCTLIGYEIPADMLPQQDYNTPSVVILYMTTAIAPAFAEEFLFRGVIYGNLRPFGRSQAILISALLFSLMHQNIGQFFYTFMAGVVMAIMYELTGNIWCSVLFHLFNNEFSVITEVLYYGGLGESVVPWLALWDAAIMVIGLVCILFLIGYYVKKNKRIQGDESPSVFGEQTHTGLSLYDTPVDRSTLVQGIKTPGLIVFAALAISSAISTWLIILFGDLEAFL